MSQLSFGFRVDMPISLRLVGDGGAIAIADNFHRPAGLVLERRGRRERFEPPPIGAGYAHEAPEAQACIARGAIESAIWPLANSIAASALIARLTASGGS